MGNVRAPAAKPEETLARALLEREWGCPLERVLEADVPRADYRAVSPPRRVEVKRLTSEEYLDLTAAARPEWDSSALAGRCAVLIDRPTLSDLLPPIPRFPDDDEDDIADWEAAGFKTKRRAEREDEWRRLHSGQRRRTVRLNRIGPDLEPHLLVLEQHAIDCTRGADWSNPNVRAALMAIARRTGNAISMRSEPAKGQSPGVDVVLACSSVRTENADTVAARIDLWLAGPASANLKSSLANEPVGERHAVLVFDYETEPEYISAERQGLGFCPTIPLTLPPEVDVLWFILGPIACRYSDSDGWTTVAAP